MSFGVNMSETGYVILESQFEYDDNIYNRRDGADNVIAVYRNKDNAVKKACELILKFYKENELWNYCYNEENLFKWDLIKSTLPELKHFSSFRKFSENHSTLDLYERIEELESWEQHKLIISAFTLKPYSVKSVEITDD